MGFRLPGMWPNKINLNSCSTTAVLRHAKNYFRYTFQQTLDHVLIVLVLVRSPVYHQPIHDFISAMWEMLYCRSKYAVRPTVLMNSEEDKPGQLAKSARSFCHHQNALNAVR